MPTPQFLRVDPDLFRRLPPARKAAAALAAYQAWRPGASLLEAADALGIPESTARRWAGWLGRLRPVAGPARQPAGGAVDGATDGATGGAVGGATDGAVGGAGGGDACSTSLLCEIKRNERERETPSPPSLREALKKKRPEDQVPMLLEAWLVRHVDPRVRARPREALARVLDDLRQPLYTLQEWAAYLDATPATDGWPRGLADKIRAFQDLSRVREDQRRIFVAWRNWRGRLRNVAAGEPCWEGDFPIACTVLAVDPEGGSVTVRSPDGRVVCLDSPQPCPTAGGRGGLGWVFEVEAMPLWRAATNREEPRESPAPARQLAGGPASHPAGGSDGAQKARRF